MGETDVLDLFRRAMAEDDDAAMREGVELMLGLADGGGLSPDREYELRRPDFVMEMPQSGERIRGREGLRRMQESFPGGGPEFTLRRVVGSGRVWVAEADGRYGEEHWQVVVVLELDADGRIARETRYYPQPFEAPDWRAAFTERM
ncbi:nuclear transport factor 2 family protein [Oryzihumus sp.]|jgi:hypothetical protein|uniref:nuclear transport factor 2 family protein n=1 Tax=Oryzihumus sp. TaxID=1968903 RepID=UPI002ED8E0BF